MDSVQVLLWKSPEKRYLKGGRESAHPREMALPSELSKHLVAHRRLQLLLQ